MTSGADESIEKTLSNHYGEFNKFDHAKLLTGTLGSVLNTTPVLIPVMALIEAILFNDSRGGLFFAGSLLNFLINYILQIFTKSKIDNPMCIIYKKMNTSGMPSIHTQTIGFLAGFIFTMMHIKGHFRIMASIFLVGLCVIICIVRNKIGCNNKIQIIIGLILGILIGSLWAWIVSPNFTPWGSASDIDYSKFNKRDCDNNDNNEDYECKAYKNGKIIETSN